MNTVPRQAGYKHFTLTVLHKEAMSLQLMALNGNDLREWDVVILQEILGIVTRCKAIFEDFRRSVQEVCKALCFHGSISRLAE